MIEIGQYNTLRVNRLSRYGAFLDGEGLGELLLPNRLVPEDCSPGQHVRVFIYHDSEDRLVATTEKPFAVAGECASLKIVEVNRVGAFADWGLSKQLLIPYSEQDTPLQAGQYAVVHIFVDEHTERLTGSTQLRDFLNEEGEGLKTGQVVDLLVCKRTDIGFKAVINNTHLGMLFHSELHRPLRLGERLQGVVRRIRPNGRIDLGLQQPGHQGVEQLAEAIEKTLRAQGGRIELTDRSSPQAIDRHFGCSKAAFKRAIGRLLKQRKINQSGHSIELL